MAFLTSSNWGETVALKALAFIASDERLCTRFLLLSGLEGGDMRRRLNDPVFLAAVLDFLLAHEPDLQAFCAQDNLAPDAPAKARAALLPPETF